MNDIVFPYGEMNEREAKISRVVERHLRQLKETRQFRWNGYHNLATFIGEPNCERAVANTCARLPWKYGVPVFMFTKQNGTGNIWTGWAKRQPNFFAIKARDEVDRWLIGIPKMGDDFLTAERYPIGKQMLLPELEEFMKDFPSLDELIERS
jgi:hypothetical protein